ncbi:MAG: hypothetical protein ACRENJ_05280 [Candidatus Eiseniibacteriota bacterium]
MWIASGLSPGQILVLREKVESPHRGIFPNQPYTIHFGQPYVPSGPPVKGQQHPRDCTWAYEILLSDANGVLARLDPEVEIKDDP